MSSLLGNEPPQRVQCRQEMNRQRRLDRNIKLAGSRNFRVRGGKKGSSYRVKGPSSCVLAQDVGFWLAAPHDQRQNSSIWSLIRGDVVGLAATKFLRSVFEDLWLCRQRRLSNSSRYGHNSCTSGIARRHSRIRQRLLRARRSGTMIFIQLDTTMYPYCRITLTRDGGRP